METKPVYKSKEVWYNIILMIVEILALATETVPKEFLPYLTFAQGVGTLILRIWFTNKAIEIPVLKKKVENTDV